MYNLGADRLKQIRQIIPVPWVAIGGIKRDNIAQVISVGADSAAVISAILSTGNIESAIRGLIKEI